MDSPINKDVKETVDLSEENPVEGTLSKKAQKKIAKKRDRKCKQAMHVITQTEGKKFDEIISETPTRNLIVAHFGNGDQHDQDVLFEIFAEYGEIEHLFLFPAMDYGMLCFKDVESAQKAVEGSTNGSYEGKLGESGTRYIFVWYSQLEYHQLKKFHADTLPSAERSVDIPGIDVIENFVTEEEEKQLLDTIDNQSWSRLANRRVQHYGYEFLYGLNTINKDNKIGELPEWVQPVNERLTTTDEFKNSGTMDQLTINEYYPGGGIPPHVDTHSPFEETIASLSLGSGIVISFKAMDGEEKHLYLPPRSMLLMSGEGRYAWQHKIATRKVDKIDGRMLARTRRLSLTFRRIKFDSCNCKYPLLCDSQRGMAFDEEIKTDHNSTAPSNVEKSHVYAVYDKIAPHFSHTRYKPWPKVKEFLDSIPDDSLIADVGCGNGKYLSVNPNLFAVGSDRSINLLEIAQEKNEKAQTFVADCLKLPIRSGIFDAAISIAVIHHLSSSGLRIQAIREMARILKPGGVALIYVWAFEQKGKQFASQDVFVPWHLHDCFEKGEKTKAETKLAKESGEEGEEEEKKKNEKTEDSAVFKAKEETGNYQTSNEPLPITSENLGDGPEAVKNEAKNATVYKRYYHVFVQSELENLLRQVKELEIIESYYDRDNWCVKLKKVEPTE